METLAYLQATQDQENPEDKELTLEALNALKLSGKLTGTLLGAAGAALAVGVATNAPAQAYGYGGGDYGYGGGCYDYGCGISYDPCYDYCGPTSYPTFVGGGYQVTSYKTYDVSYNGCYDYCGVSYGGGYGGGYDGGYYGGGYYGGGYGDGCYDHGCGVSYDHGCYDYCGVSYPVVDPCYDYCGVSYGYSTYDIQVALNYAGFYVSVDGVYGPETHAAVQAFQYAVGLVPDGIVGPATAHALGLY